MDARLAFYAFVMGILDMVWSARYIVGPFILMALIIRLVRWSWATARGERDYDEMAQAYREQSEELHNRLAQYRDRRYLRNSGFTREEIGRYRGQRGRFRW